MIDPARLKPFLDDLALLSVPHGLVICGSPDATPCRELDARFGGYEPSPPQTYPGQEVPIYTYVAGAAPIGEIYSIDVSKLSAHERIRLRRDGRR